MKISEALSIAIDTISPVSSTAVAFIKKCATNITEKLREGFRSLTRLSKKREPRLSRKEMGDKFSKDFGNYKLETSTKITIGETTTTLKSTCTPQCMLGGFGEKYQAKLYSSAYDSEEHISNLWQHDIEFDEKKISFIRSGSTRGKKEATEELLLNAAIMQAGGKGKFEEEVSKGEPINLKLSNIQLMTAGAVGTDGKIPLMQIETLQKLATGEQPIQINLKDKDGQDKTVQINLHPPLLFNFGTNVQHFKLKPLVNFSASDKVNQESFKRLFGKDPSKLTGNSYGGIIGDFLKDHKSDQNKYKQVQALAEQIKGILQKYPHGIPSNPYALPVRVMLLTNLLGYATTYNCKSGKDRTGVCALELEALAAKLLSTNTIYNPYGVSEEEKDILQALYQGGEATKIAGINTGQKGLNVQEMLGFHALKERFGENLAGDFSGGSVTMLNEQGQRINRYGRVLPKDPPPQAPSTATRSKQLHTPPTKPLPTIPDKPKAPAE